MSLLFDQNLSRRLPLLLANEFPGSRQVQLIGLDTAEDRIVWEYALRHNLTIVSKDSDFQSLSLANGAPPKFIWLQVGNGPTRKIVQLLTSRIFDIQTFISDPDAAMLILS
ncbi:MAG: DUF5615 family PIN-like protein [Pirellulales bacterium]|nr:DUF5615 family PIN-like protein [Pirellulales bacterium]